MAFFFLIEIDNRFVKTCGLRTRNLFISASFEFENVNGNLLIFFKDKKEMDIM